MRKAYGRSRAETDSERYIRRVVHTRGQPPLSVAFGQTVRRSSRLISFPASPGGKTAEFISRYFKKGSSLCITGSIQTRNWQDQQGQKRYSTEVVVDEAMFVDSRSESQQRSAAAPAAGQQYAPEAHATPGAAENFDVIKGDDDLPF